MLDPRATAREFLNRLDCGPAMAAASCRFMEMVNCRFGGIRMVWRFLRAEMAGRQAGVPLRVLDAGSGNYGIPLAISKWAGSCGIPLHFTCLEMSDLAIDTARGQLAREGGPAARFLQEDILTHQPDRPYDCAVATMCFHHFSNAQILSLLRRLRGIVENSVLVNDLRRSWQAALAARLLLAGSGASEEVRHDALLSVRRGFKINELDALLRQLDGVTFSVEPAPWFRVAAVIRFIPGEKS